MADVGESYDPIDLSLFPTGASFEISFPGAAENYFLPGSGTTTPPVITSVSPTVGGNIGANTPIVLSTTDELNSFKRIILVVEFPLSKIREVVFDGNGFGPMYKNPTNTQVTITNGYTFTILRDGGWILGDGPILTPFVIDTTGGENV